MFQENAGSNFFLTGAKTIWRQLKWLVLVIWAWCYFTNKNCYQCFIIRETARSQLFEVFLSGAKPICGDDYSDLVVYLRCVTNSGKQHGHIFCCFSFRCKADLETHSVVHSKEKPHSCHICNTSFTQKSSLKGDWPNLTLQSINWPKITKYNLTKYNLTKYNLT